MGRSAYLCPTESCLEEAQRRKRLKKAPRCQVPDSVITVLRERLKSTRNQTLRQDDHWPQLVWRPEHLVPRTDRDLNDQQRQSQNL